MTTRCDHFCNSIYYWTTWSFKTKSTRHVTHTSFSKLTRRDQKGWEVSSWETTIRKINCYEGKPYGNRKPEFSGPAPPTGDAETLKVTIATVHPGRSKVSRIPCHN
nr:hypothetical protein BgiMline_009776 [Biomphalaria glabrata]